MALQIGSTYYQRDGSICTILSHRNGKIYRVQNSDGSEEDVISDFLFTEPPGFAYDARVRKMYIGSRFYANGKIWQVVGFKEDDGRIRAQEFLRGFDTTYLIGARGAPVDRLIGPVYLFKGWQTTDRHGEAPSTFDIAA